MTTEAVSAELDRLALLLRVEPDDVAYLRSLDAPTLRALRTAVDEHIAVANESAYGRIAAASRSGPARVVASVATSRMPPRLSAAAVGHLTPQHAADVAAAMPADYLRQVCRHLSPSAARAVAPRLPHDVLAAVLHELLAHRDAVTMAEVVGALEDDQVRACVAAFDDTALLLDVVLRITDPASAQRMLRVMPPEMVSGLIAAAEADPAHRAQLAPLLARGVPMMDGTEGFSRPAP